MRGVRCEAKSMTNPREHSDSDTVDALSWYCNPFRAKRFFFTPCNIYLDHLLSVSPTNPQVLATQLA